MISIRPIPVSTRGIVDCANSIEKSSKVGKLGKLSLLNRVVPQILARFAGLVCNLAAREAEAVEAPRLARGMAGRTSTASPRTSPFRLAEYMYCSISSTLTFKIDGPQTITSGSRAPLSHLENVLLLVNFGDVQFRDRMVHRAPKNTSPPILRLLTSP